MSTLKVGTIQDHANSITAISIDSAGRTTFPSVPAFNAYYNGRAVELSNQKFPLNTERYDYGGVFNTSTYEFVAPVTGLYAFTWGCIVQETTIRVKFQTASSAGGSFSDALELVYADSFDSANYKPCNAAWEWPMTANHAGIIKITNNSNATYHGGQFNWWTGRLVR